MLQKFGFTQYESQVYEAIFAQDAPLDATSIVNYSNVPKAKIYEVLNRLIDKGTVLTTMHGKKKLYMAVDLQSIILKIRADFEKDIEELKTYKIKRTFTDEHIWTLKDATSIASNIEQLIEEADSSILFLAWNEQMEKYRELLEQKEAEGVHVEVLAVGGLQTSLAHKYSLIPMLEDSNLEPSQLIIVDHGYLLFAGIEHDSWKAIKTTSKPIVKAMTDYFYHDVALTQITKKYGDQLLQDEEIARLLARLIY
ncbi:helix-turn-helix domain-containing protein [Paenibacillus taichungensis]|uniref:TrmB family transcriptional regulator n=1 Tax=Paenibacillus TaxID=44249 RepID=UPI00096F0F6B|nr:helix-turn-helix domain-containing protein [Paenibacillus taichungensis]MDR9745586.1 helix-turn-helix domain-containing protein [Paenibacillus taichungensis]MEC0105941.1 helix-turn-helix domain-containing protein [Paenibacillus taichungensis]MEC0196630.1 helix-turn-helix domain-containing protein [Paenibacillus taichungensis]OME83247.1 TrmB family transcriptional regulator [Paenibacillus pabuli]